MTLDELRAATAPGTHPSFRYGRCKGTFSSCPDCRAILRAEHQRLKDAVVEASMAIYRKQLTYRREGVDLEELKQLTRKLTISQDALAAFEAAFPEVGR